MAIRHCSSSQHNMVFLAPGLPTMARGDGPAIHQINFGNSSDQAGFFALVFDTRLEADTGEWNGYLDDETMLELSHWSDAADAIEYQTATVVDHWGESHEFVD